MNVLFVPVGTPDVACSRVRIYQYLPFLAASGVTARAFPFYPISHPDPSEAQSAPGTRLARILHTLRQALCLAALAPRYDLLYLQRVLLPLPLQRLVAHRSRALAFDFDDAIYTTHDGLSRSAAWLAREQRRFAHMLGCSDAAFVSTLMLAERARQHQPNVFQIPSPVDTARYRPDERADRSGVTLGWIGSSSTTMYVEPLIPTLRRLSDRYPSVRIELIGARPGIDSAPAQIHAWTLGTELQYLQAFDIGIMPLSDDEWSRAKAGYKLLQYMACGTACVASPVGINREIVRHGETGLLARDDAEWERALSTLIEDTSLRERLGRAGRAVAEQQYSLHLWAPRFLKALHAVRRGPAPTTRYESPAAVTPA